MVRRDFLKLSGLFSAALFVQFHPLGKMRLPVEAEAHGTLYRGTHDGNIYISEDAGGSWRLHSGFGSQYSIAHLSINAQEQVIALVDYLGDTFLLVLTQNGKAWRAI
jgi:hypothetical protein